jgi:hypothetical protein
VEAAPEEKADLGYSDHLGRIGPVDESRDSWLNNPPCGSPKQFHWGIQIDVFHYGTPGKLRNHQPQVTDWLGNLPESGVQRYSLLLSDKRRTHLLPELLVIR